MSVGSGYDMSARYTLDAIIVVPVIRVAMRVRTSTTREPRRKQRRPNEDGWRSFGSKSGSATKCWSSTKSLALLDPPHPSSRVIILSRAAGVGREADVPRPATRFGKGEHFLAQGRASSKGRWKCAHLLGPHSLKALCAASPWML